MNDTPTEFATEPDWSLVEHDPLCSFYGRFQHVTKDRQPWPCDCKLIAKVAEREREKVAVAIETAMPGRLEGDGLFARIFSRSVQVILDYAADIARGEEPVRPTHARWEDVKERRRKIDEGDSDE